jgi:hypothetical protein
VTGRALPDNRGLPVAHRFDPFAATWTQLDDMARGRRYPTNTTFPDGRVLVVSGRDEEGLMKDIPEVYTPRAGWMPLTEAQLTLPLYPYLFVLPDGRVFEAGPGNPTRTFEIEHDHAICVEDTKVKNAKYQDIGVFGSVTIWKFVELLRANVHHNETSVYKPGLWHRVYISTNKNLIDGGNYHDNGEYGFHIYLNPRKDEYLLNHINYMERHWKQ